MNKIISTFVVALLCIGLWKRRTPKIHIPVMITAFVMDLLSVLYIEYSRSVIEMVVHEAATMPLLLQIHVPISIIAFLLYFPQIILGIMVRRGNKKVQHWHKKVGYTFVLFRGCNYITSLMI